MKKIIASDYDGTLNRQSTVSQADKDSISAWRKKGNLFGVVSGRSVEGILHEMNYHSVEYDYLIANNGAAIYEKINDKITDVGLADIKCLGSWAADSSRLTELAEYIIANGGLHVAVSSFQGRRCAIYDGQDTSRDGKWVTADKLSELESFTQVDTHFESEEQAKEFASKVNAQFHKYVNGFQNGANVDIVPFGVNKTSGITNFIKLKEISAEQVVPVGDNYNDLNMIDAFDGYVVDTSPKEILDKYKKQCDGIHDLVFKEI